MNDDIEITYIKNKLFVNYFIDINDSIIIDIKDNNERNVEYSVNTETGEHYIIDERYKNMQITPVLYNYIICINIKIDSKD